MTLISKITSILPDNLKDSIPDKYRIKARKSLQQLDINIDRPTMIIVLDSCRYDTFVRIEDDWLEDKEIMRGYTDAKWTIPSHEAILRGSIPNNKEFRSFDLFENDYFEGMKPLSLQHNYSFGLTSMPFLSESSLISNPFSNYFDEYKCYRDNMTADAIRKETIQKMRNAQGNFFALLNFGETHHPYMMEQKEAEELVERVMDEDEAIEEMFLEQQKGAEKCLEAVKEIEKHAPKGTQFILTSDHGTLIEERRDFSASIPKRDAYHKKLFEVPVVEWVK
jgi:hypothetical protein